MMTDRLDSLPDPERRVRRVAKIVREQAAALADLETQLAVTRVELSAARDLAADQVARVLSAEAERDVYHDQMGELAVAAEELAGLKTTRLVRWSAGPRRAYARLRRLVGLSR